MFVDMANSYLYIFTNVHMQTYIYYILTVYLLDKLTTFFSPMFFLLFYSEILFIINLLTIEMLGIDHG